MSAKEKIDGAEAFASEFIEQYTQIGFGALSKREIDLLVLRLLQKHLDDYQNKTDFDLAIQLRTTKRKIRGLQRKPPSRCRTAESGAGA